MAVMDDKPKVEIYGSEHCGYCTAARMLIERKGLEVTEISVSQNKGALDEMLSRGGRHSVPQVFIDDQPIGGFDELYMLDQSGDLDRILGLSGEPEPNT